MVGGVSTVTFTSNPTVVIVLCCRWGCDNISDLLDGIIKQIVTKPTHKGEIIVTNMSNLYSEPIITPTCTV